VLLDVPEPVVPPPPAVLVASASVLEERVRRLEETIAQLMQERQGLKHPVVPAATAVAISVPTAKPAPEAPPADSGGAVPSLATVATLVDVGQRLLGHADGESKTAARERSGWLIFDALAELRVMLRMYADPRYRMSWRCRTIPPVLVGAIVFSFLWVPGGSYNNIGWFICKPFELALTYALFKLLCAEVQRYRELTTDLPSGLR
jgi:hypothetical protein